MAIVEVFTSDPLFSRADGRQVVVVRVSQEGVEGMQCWSFDGPVFDPGMVRRMLSACGVEVVN
jgi:hypothetical protein